MHAPPPISTLFPYTTLFRSVDEVLPVELRREERRRELRQFLRRLQCRDDHPVRSEEHTSELQSRGHIVCRLLLEKKNKFVLILFILLLLFCFSLRSVL